MSDTCSATDAGDFCSGRKTSTSSKNRRGNDQQGMSRVCWHFHQLFRHLRTTNRRTLWNSVLREFGHLDNLLGGHSDERLHEFHHLVPNCGTGTSRICTYGKISTMCAAVCLRPHLNERCRPGGKHVSVVVHRACRPGRRSLLAHGVVHLVTLSPGPCRRRSPWSWVMQLLASMHGGVALSAASRLLCQGRGQQACQPLMPFSCRKHTKTALLLLLLLLNGFFLI